MARAAIVRATMVTKMKLTTTAAAMMVLEEREEEMGVVEGLVGGAGGVVEIVQFSTAIH